MKQTVLISSALVPFFTLNCVSELHDYSKFQIFFPQNEIFHNAQTLESYIMIPLEARI